MAVAMSGGVDSSVAAARVAARGLRAFAVTLAMWPRDAERRRDRGCCSIDSVEDARRVASALGMRHYVWNLEAEFEENVIAEFLREHAGGRTPNPCTRCNERVKFGLLLERARGAGATHVATGHYARIGRRGATATLHRAVDLRRDQSYVLHRLSQRQLAQAVFPIGSESSKAGVRAEAAARGLVTAAKPESQDLCFVEGSLHTLLRNRLGDRCRPGPILAMDGSHLGTHEGAALFTVGQRAGLGVRPQRPDQRPLYVLEVRAEDNTVVVGERRLLRRNRLMAERWHWVGGVAAPIGWPCHAQLRAHGEPHPALVERVDETNHAVELRFVDAVEHVSPGQAVVLYGGDEVIGGGVIRRAA